MSISQKVVITCEDRSMYNFCDRVLQKNCCLLIKLTGNPCFNGFYFKMNIPQHVLTVTNLFEYKTNSVSKESDITLFHFFTLCLFSVVDVLTSKGYIFFLKEINTETLFCTVSTFIQLLALASQFFLAV